MSLYLAHSRGLSEMRVLIGEQIVLCYVVAQMEGAVMYISSDVAEHIKETHIAKYESGDMKDVWEPHLPKHVHFLMEPTPGAQPTRGGNRAWTSKLSKLASGTTAYDTEARRRYREKKRKERQEENRCPTTRPEDSTPSHATA